MNAQALILTQAFDLAEFLELFGQKETLATGTVVMHHGKVKRPGKKVPDFSRVLLTALVPDPRAGLLALTRQAVGKFSLNQALVAHRLGEVEAGEDVLFAAVSAATRGPAFAACAWLVDRIKEEGIIRLTECP